MSILDRIRSKIQQQKSATVIPGDDAPAGSNTVVVDEPAPANPKEYRLPLEVGEYLPWKGHVFKVRTVDGMSFTADCVGITKSRAEKIGVVR